jgi:hypothetical protein
MCGVPSFSYLLSETKIMSGIKDKISWTSSLMREKRLALWLLQFERNPVLFNQRPSLSRLGSKDLLMSKISDH